MALDLGTLVGKLELDGDKFDASLEALPGKLQSHGKLLAAGAGIAAAGITAALAKGIDTGLDMQDASQKAMAELGLTKTQSAQVGQIAGKLYASNYGDSIEGVSDAITDVISSIDGMRGANASTVQDMTAKVLNFNSTFGTETERTTQLVGQLLKSGLVKDADTAMDLLTKSMQSVPKGVRDDLLDAVDEYTPFFQQLGISGKGAFEMLVDASAKGMYGIDKTGDALKEFSIRATDLNDTGAQASLKALGISGTQAADELLKGGQTARNATTNIVDGLLNIQDPAKQAALAGGLFGTQIEDLNKGQLRQFLLSLDGQTQSLGKVAGATDKMGAAINGGARKGWDTLTRQFMVTVGIVGQQLVPIITDVITWLNKYPAVLGIVAGAVLALALAFGVMTVASNALAVAMLTNPLTWIIVGIIAAVAALAVGIALLVTHWSQVVSFFQGVGSAVWTWLQGVIQGFVDWWNGIWSGFGSAVTTAWNAIVSWITGLPATLLGGLQALGEGILAGLRALPGLLYQGLTTALAAGLVALYLFFVVLPVKIVGWLASAGTWLLKAGKDLLTGMAQGIVTGWQNVVAFFAALPGNIVRFVLAFGSLIVTYGSALLKGLASGITTGATAVWSFLTALPGRVIGFVTRLPGLIVSYGSSMLRGLASGASSGASAVWSFLSGLPGSIISRVSGFGSTLLRAGGDLMRGLLQGIRNGLGSILSAIGGMAGDIMDKFKSMLGIHSPSRVFAGFGMNIGQGLINGLAGVQSDVDAQVAGLVSIPDVAVGMTMDSAARAGAYGVLGGGTGATVDARTIVQGNVGWDADEVARRNAERVGNTLALAGIDNLVVA